LEFGISTIGISTPTASATFLEFGISTIGILKSTAPAHCN
jgi:hypothetical protein